MALKSPTLQSWHWEAVLLPMATDDELRAITRARQALRGLTGHLSLEGLEVLPEPDEPLVINGSRDGRDEFDLEIAGDLVAYQHDTESVADLLRHFQEAAELVLKQLTHHDNWFENCALRTVIGYRFALAGDEDSAYHLERLGRLASGARALAPRFGSAASQAGLELSCGYLTRLRGVDVEFWVELAAHADDREIGGTVFIQTPEGQRPKRPWMTNVSELHDEVWTEIVRLADTLAKQ